MGRCLFEHLASVGVITVSITPFINKCVFSVQISLFSHSPFLLRLRQIISCEGLFRIITLCRMPFCNVRTCCTFINPLTIRGLNYLYIFVPRLRVH